MQQERNIAILKEGEALTFTDFLYHSFSYEFTFFKENVSTLITNIATETVLLAHHQFVILTTVNKKEYSNTYVCSPYGNYIGQAQIYKNYVNNKPLKYLIFLYTKFVGLFFRLGKINKTIIINNSLATNNFHPLFLGDHISEITKKLIATYPKHAIMVPRINKVCDDDLLKNLGNQHYLLLPTRMVHLYDPKTNFIKNKNLKSDLALLKKSEYKVVSHETLTLSDLKRIHELYEMLFFKKHRSISPQYTLKYFIECHENLWYEFTALRNKEGVIDAFISSCQYQRLIIGGPSGYDISKPKQMGLMRMILVLSLKKAYEQGCIYNAGASNDQFKQWRGSLREMEYNAVYCEHLSYLRRLPWRLLNRITNRLLKPLFEKGLL